MKVGRSIEVRTQTMYNLKQKHHFNLKHKCDRSSIPRVRTFVLPSDMKKSAEAAQVEMVELLGVLQTFEVSQA